MDEPVRASRGGPDAGQGRRLALRARRVAAARPIGDQRGGVDRRAGWAGCLSGTGVVAVELLPEPLGDPDRAGEPRELAVGLRARERPCARAGWSTCRSGTARALEAIHCALEVTVDLLAITVLGIKFSGTLALEIGVVVLIVIGLVWFTTMRQRRR